MKKRYQNPELTVTDLLSEDICTTSEIQCADVGLGDEINFSELI